MKNTTLVLIIFFGGIGSIALLAGLGHLSAWVDTEYGRAAGIASMLLWVLFITLGIAWRIDRSMENKK